MSTILDFQIQSLSAESYSLTVCERHFNQPLLSQQLVSGTFSHRVDFLTDFSVDRLNASTKDPAERFDELQKLGRELYQELFPPAVEQVWKEYKQHSECLVLCLRFAAEATKLDVLPWETLHDGAEFIAAGAKTTLTRLPLDVTSPKELPPIPRPLKLFGFFASPLDLQDHERLNAEREQEILLEAINDPAGQGRIVADFEDEANLEILARSLRNGYHILHFTGHGISPRDGGGLLLEDAHGKKLPASIAEVMQVVQSGADKLRLAVISGCQTARTLHTGAFSDLARELLRQRVPAVIAMQFSLSDPGGLIFAEVLYKEIAKGVELELAVHAARRVLLADKRFFINNDALAIVLLTADGACLQTTAAEAAPPQAEPGATYLGDRLDPLAHGFYGRRREYRKIRNGLLRQDQRAVVIHGIGGIGKTALLTHAINRLRPRFKDVMSFDCRRASLAPETILLELHRYFAMQGMPQLQSLIGQNVPPQTVADEIARMLTQWPLLIVFDNFESQLDEKREIANEDLRVFLTTLVRVTATGSRFLFTTRYLFDLDGERLGNLQELPLGDLSRPEALMLMQKLPNLAQAALRFKDATMEKFGRHPKGIVLLNDYCRHQPLDQALQDASSLESELREFLAIELSYWRLSDPARELLNRLAAFRKSVPCEAAEWVMREESDGAKNLNQLIAELTDWGLLTPIKETGEFQSLAVHSLVRDFCREKQVGDSWRSKLRDAAAFYIKLTEQGEKTPAAVWDEMEAFELMMESEDFETSATILVTAHPMLARCATAGYVEKQYRSLLDKTAPPVTAKVRHGLGICLQYQSKYDEAMAQFRQSLQIKQRLEDRSGAAASIHQIGNLHMLRGEYDDALKMFEQSREIDEALDNRPGLAISLQQLGTIHYVRNEYEAALKDYQQSLKIKEELGNREGMATTLHQIGMVHEDCGDYQNALKEYERSLRIKQALDDRAGIAKTLHQIGNIYYFSSKYEAALESYRRSLKIKEDLNDRPGLAKSLIQIGNLYYLRSEYKAALEEFQRALKVSEEIGDRAGAANALQNIATIHRSRNEFDQAIKQYHRLLKIEKELGNRAAIAKLLNSLGTINEYRSNYDKAINFFGHSLKIAKKLGDLAGVASSLHGIGRIHEHCGAGETALEHYQRSLEIREKLRDDAGVAAVLHSIGMILENQGEYQEALARYWRSIEIKEELGDRAGVAQTLHQIGNVHNLREELNTAMEHYERALKMAEDVNDLLTVARLLHNIGTIHESAGDRKTALSHYQRSLEIKEATGDRVGKAQTLSQMVSLMTDEGRYFEAVPHMFSALRIISDPQLHGAGISLDIFRELRLKWGAVNFDAAWWKATSEDVPDIFRVESEVTTS
jgi:tetratricopeptide (TPR) repeat protein/CHAT domain-containing protein